MNVPLKSMDAKYWHNGVLIKHERVPLKRPGWPLLLLPLKLLAKPEDKGLGDIIERTIGPVGGDAYKSWYQKMFGKPCGCTRRKEHWNIMFPLN